ncbi:MAG: hypothetical protein HOO91_18120 [Bacteroidales bacterium]|nr:hypothetical protein [Bacteroidales bacterium]
MKKTKTLVDRICSSYMMHNPYFFYREVIFFNLEEPIRPNPEFLSFYDMFVRQVDIKLLEEQSEEDLRRTKACFFFKS